MHLIASSSWPHTARHREPAFFIIKPKLPHHPWCNMVQPRLLSAFRNSRGRTTLAPPCFCDAASRQHRTQNPHQKSGTVRESHGEMDAHTMKQTARWRLWHQTISMTTSDGWQLQNMVCQIMVGLKWFSQPTKVKKKHTGRAVNNSRPFSNQIQPYPNHSNHQPNL